MYLTAVRLAQELGGQVRGEKDWRVAQANSPSAPEQRTPNGLSVSVLPGLSFIWIYRAHNDAINKAESKRHGNFERRNTSSDQVRFSGLIKSLNPLFCLYRIVKRNCRARNEKTYTPHKHTKRKNTYTYTYRVVLSSQGTETKKSSCFWHTHKLKLFELFLENNQSWTK